MTAIPINLAVEDLLSEAVCKRLITNSDRPFVLGAVFSRGGFGYLRNTANGWNSAAKSIPLLMLTDLDENTCPSALRSSWLNETLHPNFLFRVAVREVEAWLMGDKSNLAAYLRVAERRIPDFPEGVIDPKRAVLSIVETSRSRELKKRLLPKPLSTAKQGPDYNQALIEFVNGSWNPRAAALACPSLQRCIDRIDSFTPVWSG